MKVEEPIHNYKTGYVKIYRSLLDKGWFIKGDYVKVWIYLLLKATHKEKEYWFAGKNITLKPGEFITGYREMADELKISKSKIERIIKTFKNETQIGTRSTNVGTLISICNWEAYQINGTQTGTQVGHEWDENKNDKNEKKKISIVVVHYLNEKTGRNFRTVKSNLEPIIARLNDGYTEDDLKTVVDIKTKEWLHTQWEKYLRPVTLFQKSKFDSYLNQEPAKKKEEIDQSHNKSYWGTLKRRNELNEEYDPTKDYYPLWKESERKFLYGK